MQYYYSPQSSLSSAEMKEIIYKGTHKKKQAHNLERLWGYEKYCRLRPFQGEDAMW